MKSHHKKVSFFLVIEILAGIIISFLSLLIFLYITHEVVKNDTFYVDTVISQFVYNLRTPILTNVMLIITNFGGDYVIFLAITILIFLLRKKHKKEAVLLSFLLMMGLLLNLFTKSLIARPRPDISPLLDLSASYSFPSGHAMNAFVFYMTLAYFVYHFTHKKTLSIIGTLLAVIIILLIGFSRVYLGVHYPSDILGGYIAGLGLFVTVILLDKTLITLRMFKKRGGEK